MDSIIQAPKELTSAVYTAELGASDESLKALRLERGNLIPQQGESIRGDLILVGQPEVWRLQDQPDPCLMLQTVSSYLPAHNHRILSARFATAFHVPDGPSDSCIIKDVYPRFVGAGDARMNRTIWVRMSKAGYRFVDEPPDSEHNIKIEGTDLIPKIVGAGQGTATGIWSYYATRDQTIEGCRVNHMLISVPHATTRLEISFEVSAIVETPLGILPFSVRKQLDGNSRISLDLLRIKGIHGTNGSAAAYPSGDLRSQSQRKRIFISYSHKDRKWLDRLQVHLMPLERAGLIDRWDDTKIKPGSKWHDEIKQAINLARVAVLLISPDFLASRFIAEYELPVLLASAERQGTTILPVVISPCLYSETVELSRFQSVNDPAQPIVKMSEGKREEVFLNVALAIKDAFENRK